MGRCWRGGARRLQTDGEGICYSLCYSLDGRTIICLCLMIVLAGINPTPLHDFNIKQSQSNRTLSGCLFLQKGENWTMSVPLLGFTTAFLSFLVS